MISPFPHGLCVEIEDEAGAFGEVGIDIEVAVHLQGHLLTGGKAEAIACGEISDFKEWLEHILA